ncbi:MAG: histidine phosphatase family protein [Flavobacteriaceae bacterium]|nr:histidine phosphatase family protein [Flavobacteriaceae bacterium]
MKKITFLRHAKSSWEYNVPDRDRPLMEKGINDIKKVSNIFVNKFVTVQVVFSSPAIRAVSTALTMMNQVKIPLTKFKVMKALYTFNGDIIIDFVSNLDDKYEEVILVGHNPAFSVAANYFCTDDYNEIKTSGFIQISFNSNKWASINNGTSFFGSK